MALILPELSGSAIGHPDVNVTINMAANGVGTIAITATGMYVDIVWGEKTDIEFSPTNFFKTYATAINGLIFDKYIISTFLSSTM